MSDHGTWGPGEPRPPRQHAYPTPVAPPRQHGPWGPPGNGPGRANGPAGPGDGRYPGGAPGGGGGNGGWGNGGGWWRGGGRPQPRRSTGVRSLVWTAAIVAVVAFLLHTHRISEGEVIFFCVLIPSLILHEVSHGVVALAFGDDTAQRAGRLSLNPLRHVDVVGTLIIPAITLLGGWPLFGWAKPVPVNVGRLRSPRNQGVLVSLAGPFTNLVLAAVGGLAFYYGFVANRLVSLTSTAALVVFYFGLVNVWVALFNLIPIPPLDGSAVLERLLPASWWPGYLRLRPYGLIVIFGGLVLLSMAHLDPLGSVFVGIQRWWYHLLGL